MPCLWPTSSFVTSVLYNLLGGSWTSSDFCEDITDGYVLLCSLLLFVQFPCFSLGAVDSLPWYQITTRYGLSMKVIANLQNDVETPLLFRIQKYIFSNGDYWWGHFDCYCFANYTHHISSHSFSPWQLGKNKYTTHLLEGLLVPQWWHVPCPDYWVGLRHLRCWDDLLTADMVLLASLLLSLLLPQHSWSWHAPAYHSWSQKACAQHS